MSWLKIADLSNVSPLNVKIVCLPNLKNNEKKRRYIISLRKLIVEFLNPDQKVQEDKGLLKLIEDMNI